MRVCVVTHYMPPHVGGIERVAERLARAYVRRGWDVTWVATATPGAPGTDRDAGVVRRRLAAWNGLERTRSIPYPLLGPGALATIARAAAGADVVHVHDCLYLTSAAAVAGAARGRRPVLLTQHVAHVRFGPLADAAEHLAYRTLGRTVLGRAAHVVFVSEPVATWFGQAGLRPRAASLVGNGVDLDAFTPADGARRAAARAALGLPDGPLALFVGRLVPKKRIGLLIEASRASGVRAVVVGDGPDRDRLPADAVHLPALDPERVRLAYAAADVFVLPSAGEGLPVALLEALASGLPAVVSEDPAFDGVVGGGAARRASSPAELAAAISRLASDGADLAARARAWAREHADARAMEERYVALLADLAGA